MKVRWTHNGVRLRITPTELEALRRGEQVTEVLSLTGGSWSTVIAPGTSQTALYMEGSTLRLALSESDLHQLAAPGAEGVYFKTENEPALRYYIEKDFPCVHPRTADALEPTTETFNPPDDFEARKS